MTFLGINKSLVYGEAKKGTPVKRGAWAKAWHVRTKGMYHIRTKSFVGMEKTREPDWNQILKGLKFLNKSLLFYSSCNRELLNVFKYGNEREFDLYFREKKWLFGVTGIIKFSKWLRVYWNNLKNSHLPVICSVVSYWK